ncbi:MAG TPA: DUF2147 domain-containing protein [Anaeromyxobacter sp.]|nr:DUF2147 domain-containing protein [Anaeromyxobacter sp.]
MTSRSFVVCALLAALPLAALAAPTQTPVGKWRTIDDASGKPKSVVAIWEEGGKLFGKVDQLLDPKPDDPDPKCTKCQGELKDQRILGMRIMWDFRPDASDNTKWSGGRILDPDNGKVYRCTLTPAEDGNKLLVRGYVGIPVLGRTQTWIREE